jgi:glycosyltransferase involved in cell wall biosynthesis
VSVDSLRGQKILIVSPNEWGDMRVSKHHYAEALARRGNQVFYLNPPDSRARDRIRIEPVTGIPGLTVVTYRPFVPYAIRFRSRFVFNHLVDAQIHWLLGELGVRFDVVWCFDVNLYSDLRRFRAALKIFHPVDQVSLPYQIDVAAHADVVLSVSNEILLRMRGHPTPQLRVEHGLGQDFIELAQRRLLEHGYRSRPPLKAAYVGNLQMPFIDRAEMLDVIAANEDVEFHFWGPRTGRESNLGTDSSGDGERFIAALEARRNVVFHGAVPPSKLAAELEEADLLLMCYDVQRDPNRGCNSHKILEYLSTGRAIVANHVLDYATRSDLMEMASGHGHPAVSDVFRTVVREIDERNDDAHREARLLYALDNSYDKQVERIERFVAGLGQVEERTGIATRNDVSAQPMSVTRAGS